MTRVEELYRQVQELSPDERAEFESLLDLGQGIPALSPEWDAEVARRLAEPDRFARNWNDLEREYLSMKERKHRPANP